MQKWDADYDSQASSAYYQLSSTTEKQVEHTNMQASPKIADTTNFLPRFIWRPQIIETGRKPRVKSHAAVTPLYI